MVAIIDYGAGNLQSVKKALDFIGAENVITGDKNEIDAASHIILPGVGSFEDAMNCIREHDLENTIKKAADGSKHFLGICLGLQLLFSSSEESPGVKGLGIFDGEIVTIPRDNGLKVPHIGWNKKTAYSTVLRITVIFILCTVIISKMLPMILSQALPNTEYPFSAPFKGVGYALLSFTPKKAEMRVLHFFVISHKGRCRQCTQRELYRALM